MAWLILLAIIVYIALSDAALRSLAEAKQVPCDWDCISPEVISVTVEGVSPLDSCDVCGLTPRRTRRYDEGVCEIVVKDYAGHYYFFIFKPDRMMDVLDVANTLVVNDEFGFDLASALTVARGLDFCWQNLPKTKGGAS